MITITPLHPAVLTLPNRKNNVNRLEKSPAQDTVNISFKQTAKAFLDSVKYIPSKVWIDGKLVNNPDIINQLKPMQNFSPQEKKNFVTEYCDMTGFPDLKEISRKINEEIVKVITECCRLRNTTPLFTGYERNCSVSREKALPGSDCDGFIVVTNKPQWEGVNRAELGFEMNQRIVDSTGMHFPEVFSIEELMPAIKKAESIFWENRLWENEEKYLQNLSDNGNSYVKAAQFNIDIAQYAKNDFEKDMICHAALFVENLRAGKVLINNIDEDTLNYIKRTAFYRYSNITRAEGLSGKLKPKLENREILSQNFPQMSDEEKFQVCKNLLMSSMGIETDTQGCFKSFDMGDILELYKKISSWIN